MTAVALLIACVPEGLPLAIAIATALSTDILVEQNLLIKNLSALEKAGILTDIVVSKTSTLTEGDSMKVSTLYCAGDQPEDNPCSPHIRADVRDILESCVLLCSDAYMSIDDNSLRYVPDGNAVDKCMFNWLNNIGVPVYEKIVQRQREFELETKLPFNPNTKKMTVVYKIKERGQEFVRIVMKGAPEVVVQKCGWRQEEDRVDIQMDESDRIKFLDGVVKMVAG